MSGSTVLGALGAVGIPQLLSTVPFPVHHTETWECGGLGDGSCVLLERQSNHREIVCGGPQEQVKDLHRSFSRSLSVSLCLNKPLACTAQFYCFNLQAVLQSRAAHLPLQHVMDMDHKLGFSLGNECFQKGSAVKILVTSSHKYLCRNKCLSSLLLRFFLCDSANSEPSISNYGNSSGSYLLDLN